MQLGGVHNVDFYFRPKKRRNPGLTSSPQGSRMDAHKSRVDATPNAQSAQHATAFGTAAHGFDSDCHRLEALAIGARRVSPQTRTHPQQSIHCTSILIVSLVLLVFFMFPAASSFNAANSVTSQLRSHTPRRRNVLLTPARFQPGFTQTPVGVSNNALFTKSQWFTSQSIMQDNIDIDFSEFLYEKVSMNRINCRCTCQLRDGVTSGHSG